MRGESIPRKEHSAEVPADDPWEDVVISILSVNQYSLEHTYRTIKSLRKEGLVDPLCLIKWDQNEMVERLKSAGCDRGTFMTNLFALRLANLGALINGKGLEHCTHVILCSDPQAIEELLLPVNGIGPKVIANFCLLRGIPNK